MKMDFPMGKPARVLASKPVRVQIVTDAGSVIECLSTPNDPAIITNFGDISTVEIVITDDSLAQIHLVE